MVSSTYIVVLCFALATLTVGAPNFDRLSDTSKEAPSINVLSGTDSVSGETKGTAPVDKGTDSGTGGSKGTAPADKGTDSGTGGSKGTAPADKGTDSGTGGSKGTAPADKGTDSGTGGSKGTAPADKGTDSGTGGSKDTAPADKGTDSGTGGSKGTAPADKGTDSGTGGSKGTAPADKRTDSGTGGSKGTAPADKGTDSGTGGSKDTAPADKGTDSGTGGSKGTAPADKGTDSGTGGSKGTAPADKGTDSGTGGSKGTAPADKGTDSGTGGSKGTAPADKGTDSGTGGSKGTAPADKGTDSGTGGSKGTAPADKGTDSGTGGSKGTAPADKGTKDPAPTLVYEFGTPSKYDQLISPVQPVTGDPSPTPKDYTANAKYTDDQSRKITYARIEVFQTGTEGSAQIVGGEIGSNSLNVAITAKKSLSYKHDAKFYTSPIQSNFVVIGNATKNDVKLATAKGSIQYNVDTKVVIPVKYPGTNEKLKEKKITYVVITTKQTSNKLSAAVTQGKLKESKEKDKFEVTITADATKELSYEVNFYSSAARSQPLIFTAAVSLLVFLWNRVAKI